MSGPTAPRAARPPVTVDAFDRAGGAFVGTGTLVRFLLRRDRIRIPVWIAALTLTTVGTGAIYPELYPTAADRQAQAEVMTSNPAMAVMSGPGYGAQDYTFGAMFANEILGFVAVLIALMSVLLLVRHTRAEEESDRAELVRASVVGRHAHLTAAIVTVVAVNLVIGLLVAVGYAGLGIESVTWAGSVAFGAGVATVGIVFVGIAAVTAQVAGHPRGASGMAAALIGVAYALRAAGDMGDGTLSWLSPIGWAQQTRPYVDERWWPLLLAVAVSGLLAALAYTLSERRDVGAGMLPQRPGPAGASPLVGNPFGFAWRLQRSTLLGWATTMALFGAAYGSTVGVIGDYADNELIQEMMATIGGASMVEQWLSMIVSLLAIVCSVFAVQAALRLRTEEVAGRAEPVLATALSRTRWVATHLSVSFAGGAIVLLVSGVSLGLGAALSEGDAALGWSVVGAALAYLPALWVTAALAIAVFGLAPKAVPLAWGVLAYSVGIAYFGALLQAPAWLMNLSPFGHVPRLPGESFTVLPMVVLTLLAAGLVAAGVAGFGRRDLDTS